MSKLVIPTDLSESYERLRSIVDGYDSLLVAYSGGVDSGLLAWVANDVLGRRALAVIGLSASLPDRERVHALEFLDTHAITFEQVRTEEMNDPRYRVNDTRAIRRASPIGIERFGHAQRPGRWWCGDETDERARSIRSQTPNRDPGNEAPEQECGRGE